LLDPLKTIVKNCKKLNNFDYESTQDEPDIQITQLLQELNCDSLKNFSCDVKQVNDIESLSQQLSHLASRSPELESFSFIGADLMSFYNIPIQPLLKSCPKLQSLSLLNLVTDMDRGAEEQLIQSVCVSNIKKFATSQVLSHTSLSELLKKSKVVDLLVYPMMEKGEHFNNYMIFLEFAEVVFNVFQKNLIINSPYAPRLAFGLSQSSG
jgi:hypothetical protein